MRTKTIFGLSLCLILAFCLYMAPSANAASEEEEVLQVTTNFVSAWNTLDFDLMSSLYLHSPKTTENDGVDFAKEDGEWKIWHIQMFYDYVFSLPSDLSRPGARGQGKVISAG